MNWRWASFPELSKEQLYDVLALRMQVFMLEQKSLYLDIDGEDQRAMHLLGLDDHKNLVAYARVFAPGEKLDAYIGRIVLDESVRGQGLGKVIMQQSLAYIHEHWPGTAIMLSAQQHLDQFYQNFGFAVCSNPYDDGGVMHVDMTRKSGVSSQ